MRRMKEKMRRKKKKSVLERIENKIHKMNMRKQGYTNL